MWEQASRLEDGDYEQSAMVQLFLDCVDRTNEQHAALVSCRERPMHEDDQQSQAPRVVDLILDECVWAIVDDGCNRCSHSELWRRHAEDKIRYEGLKAVWLHRMATTFHGAGTRTTSGKLTLPMAVKLEESGRIIPS